jgi:NitT/TauT family transport system ATP-binding protein
VTLLDVTALLSIVAGLISSTRGDVRIEGRAVSEPYTKVGIVFQSDLLLDWRTVLGNPWHVSQRARPW